MDYYSKLKNQESGVSQSLLYRDYAGYNQYLNPDVSLDFLENNNESELLKIELATPKSTLGLNDFNEEILLAFEHLSFANHFLLEHTGLSQATINFFLINQFVGHSVNLLRKSQDNIPYTTYINSIYHFQETNPAVYVLLSHTRISQLLHFTDHSMQEIYTDFHNHFNKDSFLLGLDDLSKARFNYFVGTTRSHLHFFYDTRKKESRCSNELLVEMIPALIRFMPEYALHGDVVNLSKKHPSIIEKGILQLEPKQLSQIAYPGVSFQTNKETLRFIQSTLSTYITHYASRQQEDDDHQLHINFLLYLSDKSATHLDLNQPIFRQNDGATATNFMKYVSLDEEIEQLKAKEDYLKLNSLAVEQEKNTTSAIKRMKI